MASKECLRLAAAAPVVFLVGCVKDSSDGDKHTFTYETWVPASLLLGGLVAAPAGWKL
jgi:hypothetical protein